MRVRMGLQTWVILIHLILSTPFEGRNLMIFVSTDKEIKIKEAFKWSATKW